MILSLSLFPLPSGYKYHWSCGYAHEFGSCLRLHISFAFQLPFGENVAYCSKTKINSENFLASHFLSSDQKLPKVQETYDFLHWEQSWGRWWDFYMSLPSPRKSETFVNLAKPLLPNAEQEKRSPASFFSVFLRSAPITSRKTILELQIWCDFPTSPGDPPGSLLQVPQKPLWPCPGKGLSIHRKLAPSFPEIIVLNTCGNMSRALAQNVRKHPKHVAGAPWNRLQEPLETKYSRRHN